MPIRGSFDAAYGGGQTYVRDLAYALRQNGCDVTVLECIRNPNGGQVDSANIGVSDRNGIRLLRLYLAEGSAQPQVEAALREGITLANPDIVHAHGLKAFVARVCAEMGIPCIVTAHHGGLVCPAGALLDDKDAICHRALEQQVCTNCCARQQPLGRLWSAILSFMPFGLQLSVGRLLRRVPLVPYLTPALTIPLQVQKKMLEVEELIAKSDRVIVPSKAMRGALLLNRWRTERVVVIPHGIPELGRTEIPSPSGRHVTRFAYVGRLSRVKGLHVLIQALNRLTGDVELHVVGRADSKWEKRYWTSVLKQVRRPEQVIQHGYLSGSDYRKVVAGCDAVILPSICLEVFGLSIAEAFSLGRPVIATDSGGPAEQVRNGLDGIIVPPNDVAALAEAMQGFLDDPTKARSLAENVREPIAIETHVAALGGLYTQCLNQDDSA